MKKLILFTLMTFSTLSLASLDFELVINEPGLDDQASMTIENRFIDLLNQTPAGANVYLNIYGLKMPHIAEQIVSAKNRGVNIHIMMRPFKDEFSLESYYVLQPEFSGKDGSTLSICGMFCSSFAFNHNKFMLISELNDGTKNIAIHTSNNFWDEERFNYNDFLIIKNNEALFNQLHSYFTHIKRGRLGNWNKKFDKIIDETISMYTYPSKVDHVNKILDNVNCVPGSKVYFAHSRFTNDRKKTAKKLRALKESGCDVKVFVKNDVSTDKVKLPFGIEISIVKDSPGTKIQKILGDILTIFPYEEPIDGRPWQVGDPKKNALHSKIIMIEAAEKGSDKLRKMVLVGTHNFDRPSLSLNNELLLKIKDDALYDQYMQSFLRLEADYLSTYGE